MPRKRKGLALSPLRKSLSSTSAGHTDPPSLSAVQSLPQAMSNNNNEGLLGSMCEMFSNLDPTLVEMVLSEYKEVEVVMDYLLELSTAAKMEAQAASGEKFGFDMIASFLDGDQENLNSEIEEAPIMPNTTNDSQAGFGMDTELSKDLDSLLDEALDRYNLNNEGDVLGLGEGDMFDCVDFQEQLQSTSPENISYPMQHTEREIHPPGDIEREHQSSIHLDSSENKIIDPATLENITSASIKSQHHWNPLASSFYPAPSPSHRFITPVSAFPMTWPCSTGPREVTPDAHFAQNVPLCSWNTWKTRHFPPNQRNPDHLRPERQPNPGPQTIPQNQKKNTQFVGKVLILLRGAPGSGKSTLARMFLQKNPGGVILSTDDFFSRDGPYRYDPSCLSEAHEWNQRRAKEAFENNVSPIIIDNTNLQGWEMKPYVSMAMKHKYKVTFREPDTWWKFKPKELERRNSHGVKRDKIARMLEHYERVTVNSILNLSRPKMSEKADQGQTMTLTDKDGQKKTTNVNSAENTQNETNLDSAPPGISQTFVVPEVSKPLSEIITDAKAEPASKTELSIEEAKTLNELAPAGEDICSGHIMNTFDERSLSQMPVQEQMTIKDTFSCVEELSLLPNESLETVNFVGDWPVEQTMSQRAPRTRKIRASKNHKQSVQLLGENGKNADQKHNDVIKEGPLQGQYENAGSGVGYQTETHNEMCISSLNMAIGSLDVGSQTSTTSETLKGEIQASLNKEKSQEHVVDIISEVTEDVNEVSEDQQKAGIIDDKIAISLFKSERKPKQAKRNCRHCKLALTFTNCCPSSPKADENPSTCQSPEAIEPIDSDPCKYSQTEPHEFALLWRIEKKNFNVLESTKVLIGKPDRFKSKQLDSTQENIPYRVMHHKSTFVEEDEIASLGDRDSLDILCKLFKSVPFDVLKDLFERCNEDVLWATNLLLDSGEKLHIEEDCQTEDSLKREESKPECLESCCLSDEVLETPDNAHHGCAIMLNNSDDVPLAYNTKLAEDHEILQECADLMNSVLQVVADEKNNTSVFSVNNLKNIMKDYSEITSEKNLELESSMEILPLQMRGTSDTELEKLELLDPLSDKETLSDILEPTDKKEVDAQEIELTYESQHEIDIQNKIPSVVNDVREDSSDATKVLEDEGKTKKSELLSKESLKFDHLEFSLAPELAFQLSELFGPVGIDPGSLTIEDCVIHIDLNLAKAIHKRWKESIMERHRQEALSYQLIFEGSAPTEPFGLENLIHKDDTRINGNAFTNEASDLLPFMDQWNASTQKVSLRQIMSEEIALQAQEDLKRVSPRKNCAIKLKEKQLFERFPYVEQKLLMDIFKENNYSLEKTEQFMFSVLEADPVQNVMAQGVKQAAASTTDKSREKKSKGDKETIYEQYYQDFDSPEYDDFRAEAFLYRKKQQESYRKAAEAHSRGMKQVATYYAQQGHLYGEKVKEENHRAAVQIFQRTNEFLLPENILDLHGLHVDEAMKHFRQVLQEKMEEYKQNGGKSHLSVITGRGNHSQGGIPRIKLAVIDYLTNHNFRFLEIRPGVLSVTLK
ncbi:NEDD4-binding protein 2 isoform X2 [Spea bombifrons]|uniref:NEDD4-binding protein 2 isoform X2 n=1 Tax=Spea bombifrons TaxID=233779 RepID=UPI00234ACD25|nr:NEDD4-binding protein 2 isoform X2 [Spea bombifrons]